MKPKPIDKKDQPKLILVGVMAVAAFGWVIWSAITGSTPPPAAAAQAETVKQGTPVGSALVSATAPATSLGDVFVGKDPFVPNGAAAPRDRVIVTPPPAVTPPLPAAISRRPIETVLKPFLPDAKSLQNMRNRLGMGALTAENRVSPVGVQPVPPPPPPAYQMTGLIIGDADTGSSETIAILRGQKGQTGADDRRFVKVGDDVGNGYTVASIGRTGIVLRLKQKGEKDKTARIDMGSIGGNRGTENRASQPGAVNTVTAPAVPATATRQGG